MATTTAHLTWPPVSGSTGYLIKYKLSSSSVWLTGPSLPNPTLYPFYDLVINVSTYYDVEITSYGAQCSPKSMTMQIYSAGDVCCPVDYALSADGTYCFSTSTTTATPPSSSENTIAITNVFYDIFGTLIFDPGYNPDGTGTFTQIPYTNPWWKNGPGYPTTGSGNTTDGPQNRSGVWSTTILVPQDVGFSVCINAPVNDTYYIGIGCDDFAILRIDGVTIISQDLTTIQTMLIANGYPLVDLASNGFRFWYIYPVTLTAGTHVIELIGHNSVGVVAGSASIGCEVYHMSSAAIAAATSYVDMGANLIFSSKDYVGQPVQLGSDGIGYSCPPGYSLVLCDGPAYCTQTLTTEPISCAPEEVIYFGTNFTGLIPSEVDILAQFSFIGSGALDVTIDWTYANASPAYCYFAVRNLGTPYEKNQWYVNAINEGAIGGISNLFGDPSIVTVLGLDYLVWITNYETQFVATCSLRKV